MLSRIVSLFAIACFCLMLFGQGTEPRKVIIGGDFNYPPYEYINENSVPEGYNVELSKLVFRQLGYEPEFKLAKWALVRHWLDSGDINLIQGMAFSIERAKIMYFSDSHAQTWRSIFVRKGSKIKDSKDILNTTIVIQQEDIAKDFLKRISFNGIIVEVPTQEDALKLLNDGEFDAAIVNHMNGMYISSKHKLKHIHPLPQRILQKEYCYASHDQRLIDEINNALLILSQNGQLAMLHEKWFGHYDLYSEEVRLMNKDFLIVFHTLFFAAILVVFVVYFIRRNIKHRKALAAECAARLSIEQELNREYRIFERGPVVIYKMQADPPKPLMMSDNVDQWGFSVDEILAKGEDYINIVFSEDRDAFLSMASESVNDEFYIRRYRMITKDGEIRWVLDYSTRIDHNSESALYYGYIMDITAQKNLEAQLLESKEKAEASSQAKSHFLATMSHEIRTPLNGIMGFLQVLRQMDASAEQREYYDIMYSSGRNLMKIINDILDFSKIESGKLELIVNDFNPHILIADLIHTFSLQNTKPHLEIRHNINERIPNVLHGDQLRMKQVFINLLQNALKFTESGFVEISADIYTQSSSEIRLLFCVSDSGIGIDPKKQEDIFDNFSQADTHITSKYGGTGLGLSIVKRLVELMNGFIWVESEPGQGSNFFFIIPFAHKAEMIEEAGSEASHPEIMLQHLPGMQVLLVEDEPVNQVVTKRQLEGWDIQVTVAANGQEALDLCGKYGYDAILMDIQMPVMDGLTATHILRNREQGTSKHTPVIAFTAAALVGDRERFLENGMDDYIAKPIDMNQLYNILSKYAPKRANNDR